MNDEYKEQKARLLQKSAEFKSNFQIDLGVASKQIEGVAIGAGLIALSILVVLKLTYGARKSKKGTPKHNATDKSDTQKLLLNFVTKNATLIALNLAKEKLLGQVKTSLANAKETA